MSENLLKRLADARVDAAAKKKKILNAVEARGAKDFTDVEYRQVLDLTDTIKDIDEQIEGIKFDLKRAGRDKLAEVGFSRNMWAQETATRLATSGLTNESRGIASGSIDVPSLIPTGVSAMPRPKRLTDLLVNRMQLPGPAYEYFRQSVRTTEATAVADLATKPTSTYTIAPVTDRARVIAHLSQPAPVRIWQDNNQVVQWLQNEMVQGVLDGLEAQVISGDGTGENMTGLLHVGGTTAVPFTTDLPTTLRSARTALENIGAIDGIDGGNPAWVLNPADTQAIDLLRYSVTYSATGSTTSELGFLLDGYADGNDRSDNIFGPYPRVTSPSIPQGTAVLGDWSALQLMVREDMSLMIDASGTLFTSNAFIMRAEIRAGIAHLMPSKFAVIALH